MSSEKTKAISGGAPEPATKKRRTCRTQVPPVFPSVQEMCELLALVTGVLVHIHGKKTQLNEVVDNVKRATRVAAIADYDPTKAELVKFLDREDLDEAERESRFPLSTLVAVIAEAINRSMCLPHMCFTASLIGGGLCDLLPKWITSYRELGIDVITGSAVVPGTFKLKADFIEYVKGSILKMYRQSKKDEKAVPHVVTWDFVEKALSGMCEKKDGEEEEEEDEEEVSVENKPPLPPVILPNVNTE